MKINEVTSKPLNEGPLDALKQVGAGLKGAYQGVKAGGVGGVGLGNVRGGYAAGVAQQQGQQQTQNAANIMFQKWNTYAGQSGETNPQNWTAKYMDTTVDKLPAGPTNASPNAVKQWLVQVEQAWRRGDFEKDAQPAAGAQQDQQPQQTQRGPAPGVSIVSQEPIIIKYQGKDYGLNDQGQWVSQKTGKIPSQAMVAFLDQQAGFANQQTQQAQQPQAQQQQAQQPQDQQIPGVPDLSKMSREDLLQLQKVLKGSV